MNILVFDSEAQAIAAAKKIYAEKVKDALAEGKAIRNGGGIFITDLTGWTDEQIAELKICGTKAGEVVFENGLTTQYATVEKSLIAEKWYFPLCDAKYLEFISDYEIMELPDDWQE
jgi:hypothetical protein